MKPIMLDAAGHRRSRVTMPDYHRGRTPRNKGCRYPADHQQLTRSSRSCAPPAMVRTPPGCVR